MSDTKRGHQDLVLSDQAPIEYRSEIVAEIMPGRVTFTAQIAGESENAACMAIAHMKRLVESGQFGETVQHDMRLVLSFNTIIHPPDVRVYGSPENAQ